MVAFDRIYPGLTAERELTVEERHSVLHTGQPVLSTPMMISMMEGLAMQLIHPLLPPGFTTVGYEVNVKHKAPALLGARIKVLCRLLEAHGRKLLFEVRVIQAEKVIGEGVHRRTIIPVSP